jgi:hypothetical protein
MNSFNTPYAARLRPSDAELSTPFGWYHPQPTPRAPRRSRFVRLVRRVVARIVGKAQ